MNKKKPVNCGCGGDVRTDHIYTNEMNEDGILIEAPIYRVYCRQCGISTPFAYLSEVKAIMAWNRAMGEQTAVVKSFGHPCGVYGYCSNCGGYCVNEEPYCSHCGVKVEWE